MVSLMTPSGVPQAAYAYLAALPRRRCRRPSPPRPLVGPAGAGAIGRLALSRSVPAASGYCLAGEAVATAKLVGTTRLCGAAAAAAAAAAAFSVPPAIRKQTQHGPSASL